MDIDIEDYYRKYAPMVLRRCRFLLREEESALDAMQEVFVNLIRSSGRLSGSYPSSLLYRMATNVCLNMIRSEKRRPAGPIDDVLFAIASNERFEERFEARDFLDRIFGREAPSTREIAVMHFIDRLTHEEIAEEMGMSVSGIRKRLSVLRKRALEIKELKDE
ncbi:MAG TPA: sigma-70 family RNA polymerase sigma factor [Spirochaetota bacterium]|nr:sigma-70 family RNA polymerase sigma factor [Spirochaetota bacterium]HRZ26791.1 sigma-70 family RNA polymerase sigma factor [Spirochaetota bacterium]HSA13376.1 sigma-70 family RNA polymerase sigma factor [Spirochaetota bacterium]